MYESELMKNKTIGYLLYTIIGVFINLYLIFFIKNMMSLVLSTVSLIIIPVLIISAYYYHNSFDYPLIFLQSSITSWDLAYYSFLSIITYVIVFILFLVISMSYAEMLALAYIIISIAVIAIIYQNAHVINNI